MRTFVEFKKNLKDFLYLLSFKKKFCLRTSVVLIKKKKKKKNYSVFQIYRYSEFQYSKTDYLTQ